jgi:oxygen-dependent protoporphyrinogen oxidase
MTTRAHVAIVGAGITGLTAAHRLRERGIDVTIFEADDAIGGRIQSEARDGYLLERGPHTILERNRATAALLDDLNLESELVVASEEANRRYVVRDGHPRAVPMSPGAFLETDLLSNEAKLRLLLEPLVPARRDDVDESLGNFIRRRLGEEVLEYAVGPIIGGIYAGQPRLLSARHAFENAWRMEQEYGSMAAGGLVQLLERIVGDEEGPEKRLFSFESGSSRLVERLVEQLDGCIERATEIRKVERTSDDARPAWSLTDASGQTVEGGPFSDVVWTAPAYELADLELRGPTSRDDRTRQFDEVEYPPVTIVAMGVEREHIEHPLDGFGMLVPEPEPHPILGTLFMSSVFPGRAPEGKALLSTFVGGAREPEAALAPREMLVERVQSELHELIGLRGEPEFTDVFCWERAIPQYEVGYGRMLETMRALEADHPGLHLAGSFRDGVAVPDLIEAGVELANSLDSHTGETDRRAQDSVRGAA